MGRVVADVVKFSKRDRMPIRTEGQRAESAHRLAVTQARRLGVGVADELVSEPLPDPEKGRAGTVASRG